MTTALHELLEALRASDEERTAFYAQVGRLLGLDPALVARHHGRISESVFAANLLASRGQVIDTYDGTQVSDNPTPQKDELGVFDRSVTILGGVLLAPFMDYVQRVRSQVVFTSRREDHAGLRGEPGTGRLGGRSRTP